MNQQLFNNQIAIDVENAVIEVLKCNKLDIICISDTFEKMVVVFILYHFYNYNWRIIGANYRMTYLYVPTASKQMENLFKNDLLFRSKIELIISNLSIKIAS